MTNKISRRPAVLNILGIKSATLYNHIQRGLMVKPVSLGPRAVGWPANEIDTIVTARISGASEDAIKQLVVDLTAARTRAS